MVGEEGIVGSTIQRGVEVPVERVVAVDITSLDSLERSEMQGLQRKPLRGGHAVGSEPGAHCLSLGHDLEHLTEAVRGEDRDSHTPPWLYVDQANRGQVTQCFPNWRTRDTEALGDAQLVNFGAWRQLARGDLVRQPDPDCFGKGRRRCRRR